MYGEKLPKHHVRRHEYLGDYPDDLEKAWTEEVQGVTTDGQHWYFTQNGFNASPRLRKFSLSDDLRTDNPIKSRSIPGKLDDKDYNHFGDLDHCRGYLFVAVTGDEVPAIVAVFKAEDLKFVGYDTFSEQGGQAGWCAVNPVDMHLYSSSKPIEKDNPIRKYRIDFDKLAGCFAAGTICKDFIEYVGDLRVNVGILGIDHPQGGAFTPDGLELYLSNGWGTGVDFGIRAYDVESGALVARSGTVGLVFDMQEDEGGEPEGLTIRDLDNGVAPGIRGQLHAILLRNDYLSKDNLFFKHYRISREMIDLGPPLVGNTKSKEFHTVACWWGKRTAVENQVHFETPDEAIAAGYDGCGHCLKRYSKR